MKMILLSGGSGKRLWPLSNDARSKQFLKILRGPDRQMESMLQRVWRQLNNVGMAESTLFATSSNQVDMISQQIGPDAPIIVEPERRDTFPAIALAASYLYSVQGVNLDETIIVLPVDSYVEDNFFENLKQLDQLLIESSANLALVGVKPTYPSSKYGYIVPEDRGEGKVYRKVKGFCEKPDETEAGRLIESEQAMWNCGVFAFKLDYLITHLYEQGISLQYEQLAKRYHLLKKISFDYEVVEKSDRIIMLPYEGYWKDLGTWNTLTEEMAVSQMGKGVMSEDSRNTHIINEMHIPVTVLGLSNIVVAVSPDGILVSDKAASTRLKELVLFDQRPMYEEHQWGTAKVLDHYFLDEDKEIMTSRLSMAAGKQKGVEVHFQRNEVWNILSGKGEVYLDGVTIPVEAGSICQIPPRAKHGLKAITDLEMIEIQMGGILHRGDVVEISCSWGEAAV
ncbi:sugar phosphate nucleotidyltransferase [Cohnella silvisoli]|uniref:Sugar phosphate nucleotidyltransferase n=1 Tax=Cohnella silvisoli TaxID=2873699 RepID=A0ABV1KW98_9BACL|nr:sugar phosphate nucleotidyltransferase [Cohnella silvisoli]MCD9023675.1 cupin domain-containing protein [Cohnella silvisoli]